jgi:hypothetical protein
LGRFYNHSVEALSIIKKNIHQRSEQFHNTVKLLVTTPTATTSAAAAAITTTVG